MNIIYTEKQIEKIGRCLQVSNQKCSYTIALELGPRVIEFQMNGKESVFYYDDKDAFNCAEEDYSGYGNLGTWHVYGGHRLWASPEADIRTAYPDNRPITLTKIENGVIITGEKQINNNIQVSIEITFIDDYKLNLKHCIKNLNAYEIEIAVWPITVMNYGGFEVISLPKKDTRLLANTNISLWSYTKMNDDRVYWGEDFITLSANENNHNAFKIGLKSEKDYTCYFRYDTLFIKNFETKLTNNYPDFNCNYETYTCKKMLEMESLSPLYKVGENKTIDHTEIWELHSLEQKIDRRDEQKIKEVLTKIKN